MIKKNLMLAVLSAAALSGCAGLDFDADEGLLYFEPVPYLHYTVTPKCVSAVKVVALPGTQKKLGFKSGYGSSVLSASLSSGVLTAVGQTTDTKIPETLASIAALGTAELLRQDPAPTCEAQSMLIPIENGVPKLDQRIELEIGIGR